MDLGELDLEGIEKACKEKKKGKFPRNRLASLRNLF